MPAIAQQPLWEVEIPNVSTNAVSTRVHHTWVGEDLFITLRGRLWVLKGLPSKPTPSRVPLSGVQVMGLGDVDGQLVITADSPDAANGVGVWKVGPTSPPLLWPDATTDCFGRVPVSVDEGILAMVSEIDCNGRQPGTWAIQSPLVFVGVRDGAFRMGPQMHLRTRIVRPDGNALHDYLTPRHTLLGARGRAWIVKSHKYELVGVEANGGTRVISWSGPAAISSEAAVQIYSARIEPRLVGPSATAWFREGITQSGLAAGTAPLLGRLLAFAERDASIWIPEFVPDPQDAARIWYRVDLRSESVTRFRIPQGEALITVRDGAIITRATSLPGLRIRSYPFGVLKEAP